MNAQRIMTLCVGWLASVVASTLCSGQPRLFAGPFQVADALTFYVVNDSGAAFTIHTQYHDKQQATMDRPLLIRVFDPQEELIVRHDDPGERTEGEVVPRKAELAVEPRGPGVYQVIVTAFDGALDFATTPALPWGILGSPELVGVGDQFDRSFVYVPPRLDALSIHCAGAVDQLELKDEAGAARIQLRGSNKGGQAAVGQRGEQVWELSIKARGRHTLNFAGVPVILCPDPDTARSIHGSVEVLADGTICFHNFQARAHEILRRYRGMDPGALHVSIPTLSQHQDRWLADPVRNQYLLGPTGVFSSLPAALHEQNIDPASPWFGSTHVWRGPDGQPRRDNPWTSYSRLGLKHVAEHTTIFGAVYSIDAPFNPLHKDDGLLDRIIIGALQELMLLQEHELPHAQVTRYYGGERAFAFSRKTRTFPWVIGDCPADVRDVWTDGLQRYVDRMSISQVATVVNQWSPIIVGFQNFFEGTGDSRYSDLVQRHLRWLMTRNFWGYGRRDAGYFDEAEGPDPSYNGITLHNLAWLYHRTGDVQLRESLRQCIDLFNHTIAPEPQTNAQAKPKWLGSCSFSHRLPRDWSEPQAGGGFAMLWDELPEAAPHAGRAWLAWPTPRHSGEIARKRHEIAGKLAYLNLSAFSQPNKPAALAGSSELLLPLWEHYAGPAQERDLPASAEDRFTRNFGDEFLCVRRPSYYAFIYAGRTMNPKLSDRRPKDPHRQHPRNGGGLCMFWSPAFGSSILSKNWSAYAAHTILAEDSPGGADWEDYWSVGSVLDADRAEATVTGAILNQPIKFERRYRFKEDRVECDLTLRASAEAELDAMWECFPYPLDKPQKITVTLLDDRGRPVQDRPARAIQFRSGSNEVHLIVFDKPRRCRIGVDTSIDDLKQKHEHGRVLAELPATWKKGQSRRAAWSMMAVPAERVPEVIGAELR